MSQEPKNGKPGGLILSAQDGKLLDVATEIATSTPDEVRENMAFTHTVLCQVGLPRSKVEGREFMRQSGAAWINIQAGYLDEGKGPVLQPIPYGPKPRLGMAWVSTYAVRNKEREVPIGDSAAEFLRLMGMAAGGAGAGGGSSGGTASSTPFAQVAGLSDSMGGGGGSSMAGGSDTQQASGGQADAKGGGDAGQKAQAGGQADGSGATQAGGQTSGSSMAGRVATAAAKAGKVAAGTGANLAAGIGSVMAAKADQMAANFQAGVEQTVGGKVAAAIRQAAEAEAPSFGGDSISAPAGDAEEIAAFVNRPETRA